MVQEQYTSQERKVLDVFNRHFAAFTAGDIEAVLQDFGEDSVVVTPEGVFVGRDRIRLVYAALIAEFGSIDQGDSPGFTIDVSLVSGDMLFITWHAESKQNVYPFGTDTFICDGQRITRQSIAIGPSGPAKHR